MYGYIYETTCLVTGMKYIGMHRWDKDEIDSSYLGSGIYLKRAVKKYGRENFVVKILEWCETKEELSEREKFYISQVQAPINENYYNIEDGGFGDHSEFYEQPTTESQLKALEAGRHLPASPKLKEILANYRKTVVVSEETREKLRSLQLGKKCINNWCINKYVTTEELDNYLKNSWVLGKIKKVKP